MRARIQDSQTEDEGSMGLRAEPPGCRKGSDKIEYGVTKVLGAM